MSKPHYDAFDALLPPTVTLHKGSAPDELTSADYPYIVRGGNAGDESTEAYAGDPDTLDLRFKITYAGLTFDSVLHVINQVRNNLRSARLVVPGWATTGFTLTALLDIRTDFDVKITDVSAHPVYAVDEFSIRSTH